MGRLIDAEEYEKRIKPYDTEDVMDKALYNFAHRKLIETPTAVKTGKWIRITQGADPEKYICPFCHRTIEDYCPDCFLSIRYPYCHCGADMREVE